MLPWKPHLPEVTGTPLRDTAFPSRIANTRWPVLAGGVLLALAAALLPAMAMAADGPIKIGVQAPITGEYAAEGQGIKNGVQLLVKQQNAAGGLLGGEEGPEGRDLQRAAHGFVDMRNRFEPEGHQRADPFADLERRQTFLRPFRFHRLIDAGDPGRDHRHRPAARRDDAWVYRHTAELLQLPAVRESFGLATRAQQTLPGAAKAAIREAAPLPLASRARSRC